MTQHNPIIAVIDTPDQNEAYRIVDTLKESVGCFKFGLTYFLAQGPQGLLKMKEKLGDFPLFLDLNLRLKHKFYYVLHHEYKILVF